MTLNHYKSAVFELNIETLPYHPPPSSNGGGGVIGTNYYYCPLKLRTGFALDFIADAEQRVDR